MSPLRVFTVTGTISSLKRPDFWAADAFCCEARAKASCSSRRDLILGGDVFRRVAHVVAVEGIPQTVLQHGIDEFQATHLGAVAQVRGMGGQAHAFHAAGGDDSALAGADLLRGEGDGAQAGPAHLIDAERGLGVRQAGGAAGLAGRVLALTGGEDLAVDQFVHVVRIDAGARHGGLKGYGAQLVGVNGAQGAVEAADGCPGCRNDDDVVHENFLSLAVCDATCDMLPPFTQVRKAVAKSKSGNHTPSLAAMS